jgi:hypothetical protein
MIGLTAAAVLAVACSERTATGPEARPAELAFIVMAPGDNAIATIAVEVTGPGIDSTVVFNFTLVNGTATGTARVPAGAGRRIVARAFDVAGVNTHRGDTTVTLVEGANSPVNLKMLPLIGGVPLTLTFGSTVVSLNRRDTTLTLGDTLRFTAAAVNARGGTVPVDSIRWGSGNPAVASVSATGLVTALAAGTANIVASYEGAAARRQIIVPVPIWPMKWTAYVLRCPAGQEQQQLQSIYPLDSLGNLILVGRSDCLNGSEDFQVFDLSSGTPVMLSAINTGETGINIGAHSSPGSSVGFAVEGAKLVKYAAGFTLIPIPCTSLCFGMGVWAASPTSVWVVTGPSGALNAPVQIWHYDGTGFTLEQDGGNSVYMRSIWGFGDPSPQTIYAVGDLILQRDGDGTWHEVLSHADLSTACGAGDGYLFRVRGRSPVDVWVVGGDNVPPYVPCLLHGYGTSWVRVPTPANASTLAGVWPLGGTRILVSGQGGGSQLWRPSLWASADDGASWTQVTDPVFASLDGTSLGNLNMLFFDLTATRGGQRIFAPGIGGTLWLGTPGLGN